MIVWWGVLGLVAGALVAEGEGVFFGGGLGLAVGFWVRTRKEVRTLQMAQAALQAEVAQLSLDLTRLRGQILAPAQGIPDGALRVHDVELRPGSPVAEVAPGFDSAEVDLAPDMPALTAIEDTALDAPSSRHAAQSGAATVADVQVAARQAPAVAGDAHPAAPFEPPAPELSERIVELVREWFFGGNTVVRVGILVLCVGVTLLLKYAADHAMFPVELRMASAGCLGIAMVLFGLRKRHQRPGFAVTLQGGGIAVTYLVVFFAYRVYALVPSPLAFALLAGIAVAGAALAVAQDAMALIVIGQIGGFLAPVLASSGSGNHVALFSYYLLLNAAIFVVSLRKAYRPLNVIGFLFTFGIGTAWGVLKYRSDQFATTEPFLVAFFLMYVAIPVSYAWRNDVRGWVDGSLVFGTPLAFLGLQRALVDDIPFGMAYTTLAMAALYIGLARIVLKRAPEAMRAMAESFFALAVGFGTLAVPYGLDNAGLTGATWALEGAGVYWLGVRQQRVISRVAGVVLQGLAGIAVAMHVFDSTTPSIPVANTRMLAALFVALGSGIVAAVAYRRRADLSRFRFEVPALQWLTLWGLAFLVPTALAEVGDHLPDVFEPGGVVGVLGLIGILYEVFARRASWLPGRYPAAALSLLLVPLALLFQADSPLPLLARGGQVGWPLYGLSLWLTLRYLAEEGPKPFRYLHPITLWGVAIWGALLVLDVATEWLALSEEWGIAAALLVVTAGLWLARRATEGGVFPFRAQAALYRGLGAGGLAGLLGLAVLFVSTHARGDMAPLPYVPLLNPLDLAQLLGFAAMLAWARTGAATATAAWPTDSWRVVPPFVAGLGFLWFNAMLARSVHQYTGVPFSQHALGASVPLQVAFSVSWTLIALVLTVFASRSARRTLWVVGAVLLAVVVVKLFALDLARLSTLAKIGTFLVVGLLLLVVGYFAPVPPARAAEPTGGEDGSQPDGSLTESAREEAP